MKKRLVYFLFLLLCLLDCSAQNHDHVWLFGYGSGPISTEWGGTVFDFNKNPPLLSYKYNEMNFDQTGSSICDSIGNLQLFTNGVSVYNKEYNMMQNGNYLSPGPYWNGHFQDGFRLPQGVMSIPHLDGSNRYFVLHADMQYPMNGLGYHTKNFYYSIVDMDLEGGNGKVVEKNKLIMVDTLEPGKITAVKHGNGRDWWVVVRERASGIFHKALVTPSGIKVVDSDTTAYSIPSDGLGQAVFSPDGSIYATMNGISIADGQFIDIFMFDRCSGELTELMQIHYNDQAFSAGIAISPNSRYLYVSSFNNLYQYDLQAADIEASKAVIHYDGFLTDDMYQLTTQFFMAQLAPDGKIYICTVNGTQYLHVIHQPNLPYPDCMVEQHGIHLPTYNAMTMPNFPNYRLGPLDGSPCDTLGLDNQPIAKFRYDQDTSDYLSVQFTDLSYYEPTEWAWDFGDNSNSSESNPTHEFPSDGTYEVCLTVSNQYDTSTFCRTIIIGTGISATHEASSQQIVSVFPNPAQSATNFRIGEGYLPRQAMLTLRTTTGQVVHTQRLTPGWSVVGLEGIAPGLYFWEVKDDKRVLGTGKLIVVE
ncbi:MAG: PKD domain-containing protein [Saprospiraceae bacterium]|nr:PKD domain-containing protein [Saprospiraceae bacterium]